MRDEPVSFYSDGYRLSGILRMPDGPIEGRRPVVVQGPGWMGLKDARIYECYHQAITDLGYLALVFDYRGFGDSEGPNDFIDLQAQIQDWRNAITFMETLPQVDPGRIGVFGTGGTGGGHAICVAAMDKRVRCAVAQFPVMDGEDWLHRMRREYEWVEFLERLKRDRRRRVLEGQSEMVDPREEITVATPERRASTVRKDVDCRVPKLMQLRTADSILAYRPIDLVHEISPRALMVVGLDPDAVTPFDHSRSLFERAGSPKRLVVERNTTHYKSLEEYGPVIATMIAEWCKRYLTDGAVEVVDGPATINEVVYLPRPETSSHQLDLE